MQVTSESSVEESMFSTSIYISSRHSVITLIARLPEPFEEVTPGKVLQVGYRSRLNADLFSGMTSLNPAKELTLGRALPVTVRRHERQSRPPYIILASRHVHSRQPRSTVSPHRQHSISSWGRPISMISSLQVGMYAKRQDIRASPALA